MKSLLRLIPILLVLLYSCQNADVVVYKEKGECKDGGCQGRLGSWYVVNNSYDKKIRATLLRVEHSDKGENEQFNRKETLDPGERKFLGCIERDCNNGWKQIEYTVVGEIIK